MRFPIKLYADGADLETIARFSRDSRVSGFTTNPTLMRKAGVTDYRKFALEAQAIVNPLPISFEVFSDHLDTMRRQAEKISTWGENIYVKVPITNTRGESMTDVIGVLSRGGVKVNVTAVMTLDQVQEVAQVIDTGAPSVVSVFAGRIADAGIDPVPMMRECKEMLTSVSSAELLWASPREILNLVQAQQCGCDIITMTSDLWSKMSSLGKDLATFSLETVRMFHKDAMKAGFSLSEIGT